MAADHSILPEIGSMSDSVHHLRETVEIQKKELVEKEQKCQALQRNFECLSALCRKAENERNALEKVKVQLQAENRAQAEELLASLQKVKMLESELESLGKDKLNFEK